MGQIEITVYGAEERCASCVNAPGSKETFEWLQAAIGRKYPGEHFQFQYVDISTPAVEEEHADYIKRIEDEEFFYPLIVMDGKVIGEGDPRLKTVFSAIEEKGVQTNG
ncbi:MULTISPECIES: YuzD family protein [Pontibacillus]|uniref:YuzD family protein n=1 Tax=Pontibacillus chungwhensis TaxID=265426 RepID=A0ABY8UVR6_9BACI|nr:MULTISPECIES: YuzD family protein [Pontibacillus]MCD5325154.1 YuzD family protein [Pontibacillus sp. HN14]WIF97403.1 YuzD family protein [Pontibacillus chungwhensis]